MIRHEGRVTRAKRPKMNHGSEHADRRMCSWCPAALWRESHDHVAASASHAVVPVTGPAQPTQDPHRRHVRARSSFAHRLNTTRTNEPDGLTQRAAPLPSLDQCRNHGPTIGSRSARVVPRNVACCPSHEPSRTPGVLTPGARTWQAAVSHSSQWSHGMWLRSTGLDVKGEGGQRTSNGTAKRARKRNARVNAILPLGRLFGVGVSPSGFVHAGSCSRGHDRAMRWLCGAHWLVETGPHDDMGDGRTRCMLPVSLAPWFVVSGVGR